MKWLTRERVRIDRAACAWLIKRFIDPDAEFYFAAPTEAAEKARELGAIPFVVPGAEFSRRGQRISLDAIIAKYGLTEPAILMLADIVRAADIRDASNNIQEAAGLAAILHGFFLLKQPDQLTLDLELPLFDALYRYCQEQIARR